jgi:hypothetical protein
VLQRSVLVSVLQEKPRAVRSFIADEAPTRPAVSSEDETHPLEIGVEDRIAPRDGSVDRLLRLNSLTQLPLDRLIFRDTRGDLVS